VNGELLSLLTVSPLHVEAEFTAVLEGQLALEVTTPNGVASTQVSVLGNGRGREHTDPELRKRQADYESFRTRRDLVLGQ